MSIKYWEFEDAPMKEKLKSVNVRDISKLFFESETEAYRFAALLLAAKQAGGLKLKSVPENIPVATAKRYLDYAVELGLLKHEDKRYLLTDRFTKPFRNIATYIKAWMESEAQEDLAVEFASARTAKQEKRGGKTPSSDASAETAQDAQNSPVQGPDQDIN